MTAAVALEPGVLTSVLTTIGVMVTAACGYLGVRYTHRSARAAAADARRNERIRVEAEAFASAKLTWQEQVTSLRDEVRELRGRVGELEGGRGTDRRVIWELTIYARDLLRILAEHRLPYPPPPSVLGPPPVGPGSPAA